MEHVQRFFFAGVSGMCLTVLLSDWLGLYRWLLVGAMTAIGYELGRQSLETE